MDSTQGDAVIAAILIVVQMVAVGAVALRVTGRVVDEDDDWLTRSVVALVLVLAQVIVVQELLGIVDLLSRTPVAVAHVAIAAVVLALVRPGPSRPLLSSVSFPVYAVTAAAAGLVGYSAGLDVSGTSREVDTFNYHVPNAFHFVLDHTVRGLAFQNAGYYTNTHPSNAELVAAWVMHPTGGDELTYLPTIVFGALAVLAVALIARELGGQAWVGAVAGFALILMPALYWTQVRSLMGDLPAATGVVTAVAIALRARRQPDRAQWWLLTGLAAGLGMGSKYMGLLPSIGALGLLLVLLPRVRWVKAGAVAIAGTALTSFWWFIRNAIETGNPLYPQAIDVGDTVVFDGGVSPADKLYFDSISRHVIHWNTGPLRTWARAARDLLGFAPILVAVGIVVALVVGIRRRRHDVLWVALLAIGMVGVYSITPTTGGGPTGEAFAIAGQLRYLFPAMFVAAGVSAAVLGPRWTLMLASPALAYGGIRLLQGSTFRSDMEPTLRAVAGGMGAVLGLALVVVVGRRLLAAQPWPRGTAAVGSAMLGVLAVGALAVVIEKVPPYPGPTLIETELAKVGRSDGVVAVIAVSDIRGLMGTSLKAHLVNVGEGGSADEGVIIDPAVLDARLAEIDPDAVAVEQSVLGGPPKGWVPPPDYRPVGEQGAAVIYIKK